ncbi:uncharacterized protein LOC135488043 isoform X2 [Lineus longissimus]|uniref:uncharacterized protein LOC135488043 isoform X2 n=1 Tax=Lineus longissimus TaxID=88925 RepID=UPI00315DB67B
MATTGRLRSMVEDVKVKGEHFQSILQHYSAELIAISIATESIENVLEAKNSEICHLQDTLRGKNKALAALKQQQKMTELMFIDEKIDLRAKFVEEQRGLQAQLSAAQMENQNLKSELSAALAVVNAQDRTLGTVLHVVKREDVPEDGKQISQCSIVQSSPPPATQSCNTLPEFVVLNEEAGQRLSAMKKELGSSVSHLQMTSEDLSSDHPGCSSAALTSEEKVVLTDPSNNISRNDVTNTSAVALPNTMTGSSDASDPALRNQPVMKTVPGMPVVILPVPLPVNDETTQPPTQSHAISNMSEMAVPHKSNLRNVFRTLISELNSSTSEDFGFDPESSTDGGSEISSTQPQTNKSTTRLSYDLKTCSVVLERCEIDPSCDVQSLNADSHSNQPVPVVSSEEQVGSHDEVIDPSEFSSSDHREGGTEDLVNSDTAYGPEFDDSDQSDPSWLSPPTRNPVLSHGCEPARKTQRQGLSKRALSESPSKRPSVSKRAPSAAAGSAAQAERQKVNLR